MPNTKNYPKNSKSGFQNFFIKKLLATSCLLFIWFLSLTTASHAMFSSKNKLPTTPISVPIDISKKGNKAETSLRIKPYKEKANLEPQITAFELEFIPYDPREDKNSKYYEGFFTRYFGEIGMLKKYFHPKYTNEDWAEIMSDDDRVIKLVGGSVPSNLGNPSMGEYPTGFVEYRGIPIPNIRITIINLNDPVLKPVYDEVLVVKKHPETAGYFIRFLEYIKLIPSNYKIIAEVQSDAPEFAGTRVDLRIGWSRASWK